MTTPTLARGDVNENALKATERGDILRTVRSIHPPISMAHVLDAEAAVAESARMLENTYREHQRKVARLNHLRERQGLPASPEQPLPQVNTGTDLIGRVTRREPLTDNNKTAGVLALSSTGDEIRWVAAASYVDALEALFNGVPIQVTGTFLADASLSIQSVTPAPHAHWRYTEDYAAHTNLGGMTVMAAGLLKKELRREHGNGCWDCGHTIAKPTHASIAYRASGPAVVCRPCKQAWNDSGRPNEMGS